MKASLFATRYFAAITFGVAASMAEAFASVLDENTGADVDQAPRGMKKKHRSSPSLMNIRGGGGGGRKLESRSSGDSCDENGECPSNLCAKIGSDKVCCPRNSWKWWNDPRNRYCKELPDEYSCHRNEVCESSICHKGTCTTPKSCSKDEDCDNRTCALYGRRGQAKATCCPSGNKEINSDEISGHPSDDTCTESPNGFSCTRAVHCASGYCDGGICGPMPRYAGQSCSDDEDCFSRTCLRKGVCALSDAGQRCGKDDHCINGACAFEIELPFAEFTGGHHKTCCTGDKTVVLRSGEEPRCAGLPNGEYCDEDKICASNVCAKASAGTPRSCQP